MCWLGRPKSPVCSHRCSDCHLVFAIDPTSLRRIFVLLRREPFPRSGGWLAVCTLVVRRDLSLWTSVSAASFPESSSLSWLDRPPSNDSSVASRCQSEKSSKNMQIRSLKSYFRLGRTLIFVGDRGELAELSLRSATGLSK